MLGIGHAIGQKWVYDQHYGVALAQAVPPQQAADDSRCAADDAVGRRVGPAGSGNAGRRARHRRAAGRRRRYGAVLNAIADAVGDEIFRRAPVTLDMILTALESGHGRRRTH